jgi:hypothetical protein
LRVVVPSKHQTRVGHNLAELFPTALIVPLKFANVLMDLVYSTSAKDLCSFGVTPNHAEHPDDKSKTGGCAEHSRPLNL